MKKPYSLDYSIERDTDRMEAIKVILDSLDRKPSNSDLEIMATYVLYGKDADGRNAMQRGETTESNKRYKNWKKTDDINKSLDEILDNPLTQQDSLRPATERYIYTKKKPTIHRPKYNKTTGEMLDPGDSWIPGMVELWENIDRLEHTLAANNGELPFTDADSVIKDNYRMYQLQHMIIDIRRHQFYLRDAYNPELHFLNLQQPKAQTYNWDTDTSYWMSRADWETKVNSSYSSYVSREISDYKTRINSVTGEEEVQWVVKHHHFDWENPAHIRALINYYSALYMELQEKVDSWGRTLIYDFDRYFTMCEFTPVREYILTRRIDGASNQEIKNEVQEKFGIAYHESRITNILNQEIPQKIASMARKHRLLLTTPPEERKRCYTCGRLLPRDSLFFGLNLSRKDGWASNCKECEREKRIQRGVQSKYDNRNKDTAMHEVPTGQTGI